MRERRSEARRLGLYVSVGVDKGQGKYPLGVGRQLAALRLPGDCVGNAIELVEQARNGVARGIELDRLVRSVAEKQEARQSRWQDLRDLVRGGAFAARGAHLAAGDVQELVRDVEWRL